MTGTPGPQQRILRQVKRRLSANLAQRRVYRYAVALVLAFASLLAIVLLFLDRTTPLRDKFTQIGAGLAASIIFALIYTVLANREYAELIRSEIATQLSAHATGILQEMRQLNELFLPTDRYPPTTDFDRRFNRDLTRDLCASTTYFFRGTSARYVPARLRHSDPNLQGVRVLLVDPRNDGAMDARAQDRRRRPQYGDKPLAEIKQDIRNEILDSVIALFDCRYVCTIELGVAAGTSSLRIEIFDDAIYLSLYRAPSSVRSSHPETVRFDKTSQLYEIFRDECRRQFEVADIHRLFTTRDDEADLLRYLDQLGYEHVDAAILDRVRERNRSFLDQFTGALSTIGAEI
jgi:hypothetical protein